MAGEVTDFRVFLTLVWRHLNLPDPTPIQLDIACTSSMGRGERSSKPSVAWASRGSRRPMSSGGSDRTQPQIYGAVRIERPRRQLHDVLLAAHQRNPHPSMPHPPRRPAVLEAVVRRWPRTADHAPSVTSKGIFSQITGGRATRSSRTMNNNVVLKLREFGGTLLTWRQYRAKPQRRERVTTIM